MAGRSQPNANDNFVEQLLRSGPDVSGYDQTEAEAEEVDYGETDEETRDVEGPRMERGRGTRRLSTERGKRNPISWRNWQRPEPPRCRSSSRSRGLDQRSFRGHPYAQEHPDRAHHARELDQQLPHRAQWRAERERTHSLPRYEDGEVQRGTQLERSYYPHEGPYHSITAPRDRHLDSGREPWESARYRQPSDHALLLEWPEAHSERTRSYDGRLHSSSLPLPRMDASPYAPHVRALSPSHAHVADPWLLHIADYADKRQPRQLQQRPVPEEERLVIRRPLSPEPCRAADAWYSNYSASRRVEYDPRPVAGYCPADDYPSQRSLPLLPPQERTSYRHQSPDAGHRLPPPQERSSYRHQSPDAGHRSILHAARGVSPPRADDYRDTSRMASHPPDGKGYHEKRDKAAPAARDSRKRHTPAAAVQPGQLPGPPVLPGPPPVHSTPLEQDNRAPQRRRVTLFSDVPSAADAQPAPKAKHRNADHAEAQPKAKHRDDEQVQAQPRAERRNAEQAQAQPERPQECLTAARSAGKDAQKVVSPNGVDDSGRLKKSQAGHEKAGSGRPGTAGSRDRAEKEVRAFELSHSKQSAGVNHAGKSKQGKAALETADTGRPSTAESMPRADKAGTAPVILQSRQPAGVDLVEESKQCQADLQKAETGRPDRAGKALETSRSKRRADGVLEDERAVHSKRSKSETESKRRTSAASEVEAGHASASTQGRKSSEAQKARSGASKGSLQIEDRSNAQPRLRRSGNSQGRGVGDSKEDVKPKEGSSDRAAHTTKGADKGGSKGATNDLKEGSSDKAAHGSKGGSTFVRDFYARLDRSASDRAAESKEKHTPREAKGPAKGHPQETYGRVRSSGETRDALKAAAAPKDALKELRARGGVKTLRSVRDVDVRRGSPRHQSGSPRDVKLSKRPSLPAWLGDKPEDANEWYYTDPKGKLQGPCSISSFRLWLMRMKQAPELDDERREFLKCMVWRKGMNRREPLERLLALADAEAAKQMSNKADEA